MSKKRGVARSSSRLTRHLDIQLKFMGRVCGSITLDRGELRRAMSGLMEAAAEISSAYGKEPTTKNDRIRARVQHVTNVLEQSGESLLDTYFVDSFYSRSRDEELFRYLETWPVRLSAPTLDEFCQRVAVFGSPAERRRLALALRRTVAGIRPGRRAQFRESDIRLVLRELKQLRSTVRVARQEQEFQPLTQILKRFFPRESTPAIIGLITQVQEHRRAHQAIEFIIGKKLGVGRDKARRIIKGNYHR